MKRTNASCVSRATLVRNAFLTIIAAFVAVSAEAAPRPNIILVLADDIGISGISCYGSNSFRTPQIDRLAADGMQFNYSFSMPVCGPSRLCLMTGRYPFRTGGVNNESSEKVSPLNEVAFPRLLKESGYATYATGKWPWLGHMDKVEIKKIGAFEAGGKLGGAQRMEGGHQLFPAGPQSARRIDHLVGHAGQPPVIGDDAGACRSSAAALAFGRRHGVT